MMARTPKQALRTMRILDRDPAVFRVPCAPWIALPMTNPRRIDSPAVGRDDIL